MTVFGNSAAREARAIRARARRGLWRRVTAWMGVNPEAARADAVAARWELGAQAERNTARLVRRLRWQGWRIRHDRRLTGRRFNLDHVLISPCGTAVVVADTKRWNAGRSTTVVGGRLCCGMEDRHGEAEKAARYAALVGQALGMPGVAVWPVLVIHASPVPGGHVQVATVDGMVQVMAAGEVLRVLRSAPQGWSWGRSRRVARRLDEVVRPYRQGG
ncbi:nuclease-related domain-containing protein [Streptomyces chartreusis]|uniref:nuclease-related domain-containing protein n=1 Tax=Streptomyces chartreusis TaxID=1969 RepID=UPI003870B2D0|nr:NERD domain-containing protein [Streptomyces chartreusis]